jgi:ketosteroid isomerase-like protein
MSRENVDVVRDAYEAFNDGGSSGVLAYLHADVEWDESNLPARRPGIYRGHEGVLRLGEENAGLWKDIRVDVEELIDVGGDSVVAIVRVRGRGKNTGEGVELGISQLWVIRDGKASSVKLYLDRQQALDAAPQ